MLAFGCLCVVCGPQVIADYHTPPGKSLQRDLMATINAAVDFLVRWVACIMSHDSCDSHLGSTQLDKLFHWTASVCGAL